jgi:hypothetical protein
MCFAGAMGYATDKTVTQPIAVNSRWQYKKTAAEVIVTRISNDEISYIAADKSFSGSVPAWLFLADFQPVTEGEKKTR